MVEVIAFLQNAYTRDEATAKKLEASFADLRHEIYWQERRKEGLFDGANYTGLLIRRTFGEELCWQIWWENASPKWGWESTHKFIADYDHMEGLIERHKPKIVLGFGKVASDALRAIKCQGAGILVGPHPASRNPSKYRELAEMKIRLLQALETKI